MSKPVNAFMSFLLIVAMSTIASSIEAPSPQPEVSFEDLKLIVSDILRSPEGTKCFNTFGEVEGCVLDTLESVLAFNIRVSPKCCHAIRHINENCLQSLFPCAYWRWKLACLETLDFDPFINLRGRSPHRMDVGSQVEIEGAAAMMNHMALLVTPCCYWYMKWAIILPSS